VHRFSSLLLIEATVALERMHSSYLHRMGRHLPNRRHSDITSCHATRQCFLRGRILIDSYAITFSFGRGIFATRGCKILQLYGALLSHAYMSTPERDLRLRLVVGCAIESVVNMIMGSETGMKGLRHIRRSSNCIFA